MVRAVQKQQRRPMKGGGVGRLEVQSTCCGAQLPGARTKLWTRSSLTEDHEAEFKKFINR